LGNADEPVGPKEIAEMADAPYGATRELLSQMVKDGQVKNLGRGAYVLADALQNSADNADILTTQPSNVSLSGLSGQFRKEGEAGNTQRGREADGPSA
jgi:predicted transcriptional regulator of viral defense system